MAIKVLYVEDEIFLGKIVKESIESRGFNVFMEADGANAFDAFKSYQPDICVLDIMLPNKNGFEVADEIRKMNSDVPIIFLTAKTQTEDVIKGFKLGANDYIRKPFSMEELIVRIENLLRIKKEEHSSEQAADEVILGDYKFFPNKQLLAYNEEERELSFRENELLKYLWQHRNKQIDRRDVLNLIWGNDSFFNSRNLDVYITKLRGYLKHDPQLRIITLKGIGYRFAV